MKNTLVEKFLALKRQYEITHPNCLDGVSVAEPFCERCEGVKDKGQREHGGAIQSMEDWSMSRNACFAV